MFEWRKKLPSSLDLKKQNKLLDKNKTVEVGKLISKRTLSRNEDTGSYVGGKLTISDLPNGESVEEVGLVPDYDILLGRKYSNPVIWIAERSDSCQVMVPTPLPYDCSPTITALARSRIAPEKSSLALAE